MCVRDHLICNLAIKLMDLCVTNQDMGFHYLVDIKYNQSDNRQEYVNDVRTRNEQLWLKSWKRKKLMEKIQF